jgi:hypothetical protein
LEQLAPAFGTFADLAEKLNVPVEALMWQFNGKTPPSKDLVKGLATNWTTSHS